MTNRETIEKAVISAADTLATSGALNPEQQNKFLDYVEDETTLKPHVRVVRFTPQSMKIHKIGVGQRVAVPASEARDPGVRNGVTTSQITITPKDIMVPFEITRDFLQYNIEESDAEEHVIKMMARAVANNTEELMVMGNTLGVAVNPGNLPGGIDDSSRDVKDTFLALTSGFLTTAYTSGHKVDFEHAEISTELVTEMLASMPTKYKRNKANLRLFYSVEMDERLRARIGERATPAGDKALFGAEEMLKPMGVPHVPVALLQKRPTWVENATMTGVVAQSLAFEKITELKLHASTLDRIPTAPYILDTDYSADLDAGTVTRIAIGSIGAGAVCKVTYETAPQAWLTPVRNMIVAYGKEITIERDYSIFGRVFEYAIHFKVDCTFEETDAIVHVRNILDPTA